MTWKEGTRITPQRLPAARDSIIRQMQQTITTAYANIASAQMLQSYQQDVQHLKTAPLWWVSHDMFLLSLDAAESHTEPREQTAPTSTGFIYVDGQLPSFTERGVIFPHVCAISWISEPNAKVGVQFYTNQIDPGWNSPLMPFEPEPEYIAKVQAFNDSNSLLYASSKPYGHSAQSPPSPTYLTRAKPKQTSQYENTIPVSPITSPL